MTTVHVTQYSGLICNRKCWLSNLSPLQTCMVCSRSRLRPFHCGYL